MSGVHPFLVTTWQSEEGLPGNVVRSLAQTEDGYLWVATAEGLARFDGVDFQLVGGTGGYRGRQLGFFRLLTPSDGSIWVSTFQGGLLRVSADALDRIADDQEQPNPPLITHLFTHEGSNYVLKGEEIFQILAKGIALIVDPDEGLRRALDADIEEQRNRGRTKLSFSSGVLIDSSGSTWRIRNRNFYFQPAGHPAAERLVTEVGNQVVANDLFEDREGNIWLASPVEGLTRIRRSRVSQLLTTDGVYDRAVQTAIRTHTGDWWIAKRSGGIDLISNGKTRHLDLVEGGYNRPVSCLHEDGQHRIWVASRDGSVFLWNGETFDLPFQRQNAISKVNDMADGADGTLWFVGGRGISSWDGEAITTYSTDTPDAPPDCSTVTVGPEGHVHVGTTDGSFFTSKGAAFLRNPEHPLITGRWISAILPVSENEVWLSTIGSGLFLFEKGAYRHFGADSGLPDERLTALVADKHDTFWLGSLGGILRTSRTSLLLSNTDTADLPRWIRLDRSDGLITRECVGGTQPGGLRTRDGSIWFPTLNGLAGVDSDELDLQDTPPPIHLRNIEINGNPYDPLSERVSAGPGHVRLKVGFTGISLSAPQKVTYRTRLLGLDPSLQSIGDRREMTYEAVPPGTYRFEVFAINGDGISTRKPASISLEIKPHFWSTWWFAGLCLATSAAVAVGLGILVTRRKLKRKLDELRMHGLLENERSRISRDLHDDLGASLTELSILAALAAEKPEASDLQKSVNTLSRKAREVVTTLDEIVWASTPHEDSLKSLVEYLAAFAREFLDSAHIPLHTEIERQIPSIPIGPRRRHNMFLATREALNNAVKHAEAERIHFKISLDETHLMIEIRDEGNGFDPATIRGGHGLTNLHRRLQDSGGTYRYETVIGKGTTVTITLPLPPT